MSKEKKETNREKTFEKFTNKKEIKITVERFIKKKLKKTRELPESFVKAFESFVTQKNLTHFESNSKFEQAWNEYTKN